MGESGNLKNLNFLIMAGGSGTRFWPKSRKKKPKQLLALWDNKTLLEHTVNRFTPLTPENQIWVVTTKALVDPSMAILKSQSIHFLGEPSAKNTAPCILWGTKEIFKVNPDAVVAVMPADHFIGDLASLHNGILEAYKLSQKSESIVILGIKPNRPETGYGYIDFSNKTFIEKPSLKKAIEYINTGRYLWNAGMFIFKASVGLKAFEACMPDLSNLFASQDIESAYSKINQNSAISFDYGVMESCKEKNIPIDVLTLDCGWNDVGSFTALEEINCTQLGNVVTLDANCNIVQSDAGLVALLGVHDLVVVRDQDVVMVTSKDRAQDIKALLEKVKIKFPEKI